MQKFSLETGVSDDNLDEIFLVVCLDLELPSESHPRGSRILPRLWQESGNGPAVYVSDPKLVI